MTRIPYTHLRTRILFTRELAGYDLRLRPLPELTAELSQIETSPPYAVLRHTNGAYLVINARFIALFQSYTTVQVYPFWLGARFAAERLQKGL